MFSRNRWAGAPPRPRPELWWQCSGCDWLGFQGAEDRPLQPMRRLAGDEAGCCFRGEEEGEVAGDPWEQDGELRDWVVCLHCGTSNPRRLGPAPGAPRRPGG